MWVFLWVNFKNKSPKSLGWKDLGPGRGGGEVVSRWRSNTYANKIWNWSHRNFFLFTFFALPFFPRAAPYGYLRLTRFLFSVAYFAPLGFGSTFVTDHYLTKSYLLFWRLQFRISYFGNYKSEFIISKPHSSDISIQASHIFKTDCGPVGEVNKQS